MQLWYPAQFVNFNPQRKHSFVFIPLMHRKYQISLTRSSNCHFRIKTAAAMTSRPLIDIVAGCPPALTELEAAAAAAPAFDAVEDLGFPLALGPAVGVALASDGTPALVVEAFTASVLVRSQVVPRSSYSQELPGQYEV